MIQEQYFNVPVCISSALQTALDLFPMGFMALSGRLQILAANRAAWTILAKSEVITVEETRVEVTGEPRAREFRELIQRARGPGACAGILRIPQPSPEAASHPFLSAAPRVPPARLG